MFLLEENGSTTVLLAVSRDACACDIAAAALMSLPKESFFLEPTRLAVGSKKSIGLNVVADFLGEGF